jgi:hypothetical protein
MFSYDQRNVYIIYCAAPGMLALTFGAFCGTVILGTGRIILFFSLFFIFFHGSSWFLFFLLFCVEIGRSHAYWAFPIAYWVFPIATGRSRLLLGFPDRYWAFSGMDWALPIANWAFPFNGRPEGDYSKETIRRRLSEGDHHSRRLFEVLGVPIQWAVRKIFDGDYPKEIIRRDYPRRLSEGDYPKEIMRRRPSEGDYPRRLFEVDYSNEWRT